MEIDDLIAKARAEGLPTVALAPEALAALSMPDGAALPEAVRRWLAFSARFPELLEGLDPPRWRLTTAQAFVEAEVAEVAEELEGMDFDAGLAIAMTLESVPEDLAEVPWIRLDDSASQAWFVAMTGEMPVLTYEREEFQVSFPRFVDWLAHRLG